MSGDHNMNQAKQYRRGIESTNYVSEPEQYNSAIEHQLITMENQINFLHGAIDTLENRLRQVTRDNPPPCKTAETLLPCADSPLGKSMEEFNSRLNASSERILHIIESLEI